ncbi:hypothetical protein F0Q45_05925 [Mycobacterium simiae]|uniref:LPXTG cell wall anchor domain-containing protein n=1 Tax=Mycobacterium simiae TaxID=1784 RepID=A0A5B1BV50_MYCSI|nr:WGxxGxxG family protein [Mycobacterium simiae]KAA1251114.1 hypothetical protein F0Q45_05925 [Mycobacterium simiae]
MRKTLAVVSATGALLFGGAGVAHATAPSEQPLSATTTTLADPDNSQRDDDNSGLWGLAGLLGLAGLAGLLRRDRHTAGNATSTRVTGPAPRA